MRASAATLVVVLVAFSCGTPSVTLDAGAAPDAGRSDAGGTFDAGSPDAATADAGFDAGSDAGLDAGPPTPGDAGADAGADAGRDAGAVPDGGTYRNSLSVCWTNAACTRVLAVAHGGAWDAISTPYDSNAALAAAYAGGLDGVKIDVRVTADNVPVIAHSSPITIYESLDCYNKTIETMTAAQVVQCHRLPSSTETFQRLDDVLAWLKGKMVVQLTVKRPFDYARTIAAVHAANAEDYAFLEISTSELQTLIPTLAGSQTVYYLINVASNLAEVDTLLNTIQNPRAFMFEFDPTVQVGALVTTRLHSAGVRAFTYTAAAAPTVAELKALYDQGYDVVSSQGAANNVQARKQVNLSRGVSPP